jgi:hypothetical protein
MNETLSIYSAGELVGTARLHSRDEGMGIGYGVFDPGPGYAKVADVFRAFGHAMGDNSSIPDDEIRSQEYYKNRDTLQLTANDVKGAVLSTGFIHIVDFGTGDTELPIEIQFMDVP